MTYFFLSIENIICRDKDLANVLNHVRKMIQIDDVETVYIVVYEHVDAVEDLDEFHILIVYNDEEAGEAIHQAWVTLNQQENLNCNYQRNLVTTYSNRDERGELLNAQIKFYCQVCIPSIFHFCKSSDI
jgi:hypothetical protein